MGNFGGNAVVQGSCNAGRSDLSNDTVTFDVVKGTSTGHHVLGGLLDVLLRI